SFRPTRISLRRRRTSERSSGITDRATQPAVCSSASGLCSERRHMRINRRNFFQGAAAGALAPAAQNARAAAPAASKMIGIQVGAVSFVDEGVNKVLDIFQESASINTLFVATFTYGRGIAGRQVPGQPLPDHGKQEYDTDTFKGGSYTRVRPQY